MMQNFPMVPVSNTSSDTELRGEIGRVCAGGESGNPQALLAASERFADWLKAVGYASFDPYDVWGTRYGCWARKIYYEKGVLGLPLISPILLLEMFWPSARRFFVQKQRFATADAQLVLAYLNLWRVTKEREYLTRAGTVAEELVGYAIPGYAGLCWGYPFDWQTNKGFWPKNTPYITSTPYCFEAFLALYDVSGDARYFERAASAADFVYSDLKDTETGAASAAASYSPCDRTKVINASAYRAFVLMKAAERFGRDDYREKALRNVRFILESQRADGAWLYALDNPSEAFIDHFHTCFVLKNLHKLNRILRSAEVKVAIEKGYGYYRINLFDAEDNPKSFAVEPRRQIVRLEMYNMAEAITLGALLGQEIPEATALADRLAGRLITEYQLPSGHFVTRVYNGSRRHTFPFLRWPQAQLFHALAALLATKFSKEKNGAAAGRVAPTAG
jgi:hypothetical protein